LKYLKIQLDTDLKIIFLDHQNNYVERYDAAKSFNILVIFSVWMSYIIILIIQQNYF